MPPLKSSRYIYFFLSLNRFFFFPGCGHSLSTMASTLHKKFGQESGDSLEAPRDLLVNAQPGYRFIYCNKCILFYII